MNTYLGSATLTVSAVAVLLVPALIAALLGKRERRSQERVLDFAKRIAPEAGRLNLCLRTRSSYVMLFDASLAVFSWARRGGEQVLALDSLSALVIYPQPSGLDYSSTMRFAIRLNDGTTSQVYSTEDVATFSALFDAVITRQLDVVYETLDESDL
jgi:hypothetical protein